MKNLVLKAVATAAVCVLAVPAFATTYECKLKMGKSGGNWMGPTMHVKYDEQRGTATVIDGVINHYNGKPIEVSRITDNNKRVTFAWNARFESRAVNRPGGRNSNLAYSLTILKSNMKAKVRMKPVGYRNSWNDSGVCVRK